MWLKSQRATCVIEGIEMISNDGTFDIISRIIFRRSHERFNINEHELNHIKY